MIYGDMIGDTYIRMSPKVFTHVPPHHPPLKNTFLPPASHLSPLTYIWLSEVQNLINNIKIRTNKC